MKKFRLVLGLLLFLTGCEKVKNSPSMETEETLFQQGQQLLKENRPNDAFKAFSRLLEKRTDVPETHLELGRLYLSLHHDPIFSIYHFRQYLLLEPQGKLSGMVLQMIETAKKEFARSLPFNDHYSESPEYLNLMEVLKQVRKENAELKEKIAQLKPAQTQVKTTKQMDNFPVVSSSTQSNPTENQGIYVVQAGDTLSKVSLKVYGTAAKWKVIFDANKDQLPSPNSLKIGMELRIPGER